MSSIVFIHALSKEATKKLLDKDINAEHLELTPNDYIVITDPKNYNK